MSSSDPPSRAALRRARRVCVKAGTSVVANEDGSPSLTRLGAICEQIGALVNSGVEVILVSSGAVGMGKRLLRKQSKMMLTFRDTMQDCRNVLQPLDEASAPASAPASTRSSFVSLLDLNERPHTMAQKKKHYDSACAAAGQFDMMNLYSSLLGQMDVTASQLLVTQSDFIDPLRLSNMTYSIERLLSLGILPIINENDAVSGNMGYTADDVFSDNDSLAALCARNFGCEVLLLLTDVEGVYDLPPSDPNAKLIDVYPCSSDDSASMHVSIGEKSSQGRGGMLSKINAATSAVLPGSKCSACVIASGADLNCIKAILGPTTSESATHPRSKGTLFCTPGSNLEKQALFDQRALETSTGNERTATEEGRAKATAARTQARTLANLPYTLRQSVLNALADALLEHRDFLLEANAEDLAQAELDNISSALKSRLKLTDDKLVTLAAGIRQIASNSDPLGVVKNKRELSGGLVLSQISVPIGVLMIIFESRPDSMPQIAALALASGNGLLLKGGREAANSNVALHKIIGDAIEKGSEGKVKRDIIGLVTSRGQVADMLALDDVIDLVIPRGSNALVSYIKQNTRIPVLGHADGVCHVYVDESADAETASQVVVDAKVDYPSACNAMETLLLHEKTIKNGVGSVILMALRAAGVKCSGGPRAMKVGLCDTPATELKYEYGDLQCLVEVVSNVDEAVDWIHEYGSGHTESIVCSEDSPVAEEFLRRVDAACVFLNASTRFADGYRFGLGAEVGISTGRIHARGPVGVEGLLTTKWQLRSSGGVSFVGQFGGETPSREYTHKQLM